MIRRSIKKRTVMKGETKFLPDSLVQKGMDRN
jgi:hypothetical protein